MKKEFFTAAIFTLCLGTFFINNALGLLNGYQQMSSTNAVIHVIPKSLVKSIPGLMYDGTCGDDTLAYNIGIYQTASLGGSTAGEFYPDEAMIVIANTGINTIAHEVSHAVDTIVQQKGIHDGETRAYIQGALTECVQNVIDARKEQFSCQPGWQDLLIANNTVTI